MTRTDAGGQQKKFTKEAHRETASIGVTKERVRQIQNKALAKIRGVLEEGVLRIKSHPVDEAVQ